MKKSSILFIIIFSFVGCDLYYSSICSGHNLYYGDFSSIVSTRDIGSFLNDNIDPVMDSIDEWADLEVSINRGYGDCEDFAIGFLNILYVRFDIKGSILLLDDNQHFSNDLDVNNIILDNSLTKSVVSGGFINHAVICFNGIIVDPFSGTVLGSYDSLEKYIGYKYTFDEIFNY